MSEVDCISISSDFVAGRESERAAILAWARKRADWLVSECRHGGTCYVERDQALYVVEVLEQRRYEER